MQSLAGARRLQNELVGEGGDALSALRAPVLHRVMNVWDTAHRIALQREEKIATELVDQSSSQKGGEME